MKKFFFHFKAKTPASINSRFEQQKTPRGAWDFIYTEPNIRIALTDSVREESGVWLHEGLDVFVELSSSNEIDANRDGKNITEQILSVVTLLAQVACAPSRLMSVITDIENQPSDSRFINYLFEGKNLPYSMRKLDQDLFGEVFHAYTQSDNNQRISRAMAWLRKGLEEDYPTDAFVAYWVGLEVLSGLLRRELKMRTKNPEKWAGVKDIIESRTNIDDFDKVKTARDNLLHGLGPLDNNFISEINSYQDDVRKALIYAICSLLNLPESIPEKIVQYQPIKTTSTLSVSCYSKIEAIPNTFERLIQNYPKTSSSIIKEVFAITDEGKLNLSIKYNHQPMGPENAKWTHTTLEVEGGLDSGITISDMKAETE